VNIFSRDLRISGQEDEVGNLKLLSATEDSGDFRCEPFAGPFATPPESHDRRNRNLGDLSFPKLEALRNLYWLAYLLTGNRELSLDVVEGLDVPDHANPFFDGFTANGSRKSFIEKTLAAVKSEVRESMLRTQEGEFHDPAMTGREWSLDCFAGRAELERALLLIDVFERCAVVLRVFERLSLEEAAVLLNADPAVVATAEANGLRELVRNLAAGRTLRPLGCITN